MQAGNQLYYLHRSQLDEAKWNHCINSAGNGLIYAYSFYLDKMADHWDAIVLNDYEAVMPLPWRKKWGTFYLYQPFLTAQLGVFGNNLSAELIALFFGAVPARFRYWDFSLNHQNLFSIGNYTIYQRANFVLPLTKSYQDLRKAYRENIRRNIRKCTSYGCVAKKDVPIYDIIELAGWQAKETAPGEFAAFANLFHLLAGKGMAKTYGMVAKNGDLLASAAFLFSHNRAYYILVGNHPNGRTLGASHALIDAFIQDHAAGDILLDFEGSDMRNLAFFYSSFGAQQEIYTAIRLNRLPWWMKWAK
jgi:hypothetical protein